MKFNKLHAGLTLIELMVVIVIIGLLGRLGISSFSQMKDAEEYEKFVYTLHHYTQEARNMAKVNKSSYTHDAATSTDKFASQTNYGVYFSKISANEAEIILFQDLNNNSIYDAVAPVDNIIKNERIYKTVNIDQILVIKSQENTFTNVPAIPVHITIIFKPDPNPEALIKVSSFGDEFRFVEIKFHHEYVKDVVQKSLRKKFAFDTISNFSQVNDYPIITGAIKYKDATNDFILVEVNEPLNNTCVSANVITDIAVKKNTTPYTPISATCNSKGILLTFGAGGLPTTGKIKVLYKNNNHAVTTVGDNLVLTNREIEINLD